MTWGRIVTRDGFTYQITTEDVIWAARATTCESSDLESSLAELWAWTYRFATPSYRRTYRTLASLIRAHSQPVNPRWERGGEACGPGGRFEGSQVCSETLLARRERCRTTPYDALPAAMRELTEAWAKGRTRNPVPLAMDFASSSIGTQEGDLEVARFGRSGNQQVFYSEPQSRRLGASFVTIEPGSSSLWWLGALAVAGAAVGGYVLMRRLS